MVITSSGRSSVVADDRWKNGKRPPCCFLLLLRSSSSGVRRGIRGSSTAGGRIVCLLMVLLVVIYLSTTSMSISRVGRLRITMMEHSITVDSAAVTSSSSSSSSSVFSGVTNHTITTTTTTSTTTTSTTITNATTNFSTTSFIHFKDERRHHGHHHRRRRRDSFYTHPVTNEEHRRLARQDQGTLYQNLTVAVCHPTIYGAASIARIFSFVSYYRLLGFDHVFLWIEPDTVRRYRSHQRPSYDDFTHLQGLEYVTLTEYNVSQILYDNDNSNNDTRMQQQRRQRHQKTLGHHGQNHVMELCRTDQRYAASFDWNLVVDADEFLWIQQPPQQQQTHTNNNNIIKGFLQKLDARYSYISFGKWQYSRVNVAETTTTTKTTTIGVSMNATATTAATTTTTATLDDDNNNNDDDDEYVVVHDSGFGLDRYAFTPGLYCYGGIGGKNDYCPDWPGRCKILSKSSRHPTVAVHGYNPGLEAVDGIHWNTHTAHIKEWPGIVTTMKHHHDDDDDNNNNHDDDLDDHDHDDYLHVRPRMRFSTTNKTELKVHSLLEAFRKLPNGSVPVMYDGHLASWMALVASRLPLASMDDDDQDDDDDDDDEDA